MCSWIKWDYTTGKKIGRIWKKQAQLRGDARAVCVAGIEWAHCGGKLYAVRQEYVTKLKWTMGHTMGHSKVL